MISLFKKKEPIKEGEFYMQKDKEFKGSVVEVLKVGDKNILIKFISVDGKPTPHSNTYEWSKQALRSLYRRYDEY